MSSTSVVIPTYNCESYLRQTLESVFNQTVLPTEIIISDDCSQDNTCDLVASLAKESPIPIRIIEAAENSGGSSRPLNLGIDAANSVYIVLLDHDDLMDKDRIALQVEALETYPECILVIGGFSVIGRGATDDGGLWSVPQFAEFSHVFDESKVFSVLQTAVAFPPLLRRNYAASTSNLCFSKQRWREVGGFNEKVFTCPDLDFMLRATLKGPIAIVHRQLFQYRVSQGSLFRKDVTRSLLETTMVRLRAASSAPALAADELEVLRYSAMMLGTALLRKGDFNGFHAMVETMVKHQGASTVRQAVSNKARRFRESKSEPSGDSK